MNLLNNFKKSVPSIITELNLISGVISIILAFNNQVTLACIFILLAAFFDLFDGLAARLLNAVSDFGKQLDSLADVVSFGVAPSIIIFHYINTYVFPFSFFQAGINRISFTEFSFIFLSITPVVFGSLRLARYNITQSIGNHFQGMPIPASALIIVGLWLFNQSYTVNLFLNPYVIYILVMTIGILMVTKIQMLSLKTKGNSKYTNVYIVVFIISTIVLIAIFKIASLFLIMISYIILSSFHTIFRKK